ncbi:hypothetical protein J6V85_01520 [Candidatus Saccharibacteria bacterium]|nr:hypothetical protein [Candidatus Saccharibacteria bacterium]
MDSEKKKRINYVVCFLILIIVIVLLFLFLLFSGRESDDIKVSWEEKKIGLKCTDSTLLHPALRDYTPKSHTNTIMANFVDDKLSAITLYYVGNYSSSSEAKQAEAYAQADYGLILAKEYGVDTESFSHSFMIDGNIVSLTITAENGDISDRTAPYFLLEQNRSFPKSMDGVKQRYEERNFSCEITN